MSAPPNNLQKALEIESFPTSVIVAELERRHRLLSAPDKRIAVLGANNGPRSQLAAQLSQNYGYCDLIRKEREQKLGSNHGKSASTLAGNSVAAALNLDIPNLVKTGLDLDECRRGMVLDGEPSSAVTVRSVLDVFNSKDKPLTDCLVLLNPNAERPMMLTSSDEGNDEPDAARDAE